MLESLSGVTVLDLAQSAPGPYLVGQSPAFNEKRPVVAEISTAMPSPPNAPSIPYDRIGWTLETDRPIPEFPVDGRDGAAVAAIARHAASLIRDGDTLQIGLGRVQHAILGALRSHRRLGLHSGLLSEAVLDLVEAGAMTRPMTAGVGLGTRRLYDYLAETRQVTFARWTRPTGRASIAAVESFLSINSALEIDLFGQINAEMANGRRVSSVGGLVDFMRGARASPGGQHHRPAGDGAGRHLPHWSRSWARRCLRRGPTWTTW